MFGKGWHALSLVALAAALMPPRLAADEQPAHDESAIKDELAKTTALRFLKAYKAKDLDTLLDLADAPWYEERDNPLIVTHADLLRENFRKTLERLKNPSQLADEPTSVLPYGPARRAMKGGLYEKYLVIQDEVFGEGDRIVIFGDPDAANAVAIGVRFRDGKPLVAALFK
jgi:hypothetical protein